MNGKLSAMTIEDVQEVLGCILPKLLLALYHTRDGTADVDGWAPLRLMPLREVAAFQQVAEDYGWASKGVRVFWTDDNSNYAGLYVSGPLEGKVCFIDHEETDLSPAYASLQSFIEAMATALPQELDWPEFPRDYPAALAANPQVTVQNWNIVQTLRPLYEASQDEERTYYAFCMMALTPHERTESLLAFTFDGDMYIQERACEILGLRRYAKATGRLAEVARSGMPNGQIAAIIALGKIGSVEARSHLQELLLMLPKGYSIYIKGALTEAN